MVPLSGRPTGLFGDSMDTFSGVACSDYVETKAVVVSGPGCRALETYVSDILSKARAAWLMRRNCGG